MQKKFGIIGCGWLGFSLAQRLVKDSFIVHGSTRSEEKRKQLEKAEIIPHVLNENDFYTTHDWLGDLDILILNIPPSAFGANYGKAMLNIVKQLKSNCGVIFVSSTSVYPDMNRTVNEQTPATGTNRNGPIVRKAEEMLIDELDQRLTILRMAGLVGGKRHPIRFLAGRTLKGGDAPINLVHREDCIGVIRKVVDDNFWGKMVNVCASQHPKKKTYYEKIAMETGLKPPEFLAENEIEYKIVENRVSKEQLEYTYLFDNPFDFPIDNLA
jgi:nucleoside-diphosphate-sugar epimerase